MSDGAAQQTTPDPVLQTSAPPDPVKTSADPAAEKLLRGAELLLERRDLPAAKWGFDRAEAAGGEPNRCSAGRWTAAMLAGNFELAWRQSDAIRARGAVDPHRFWQGEEVRGRRVIVRSLHGLGDAVQMLAYAPALRSLASHVIWEVPPRLFPLAPYFAGVDEVITWGEQAPAAPPEWEVQIEITELPYLFRSGIEDLPVAMGYLDLPPGEVREVSAAMDTRTRPRIGLCWTTGEWNPARNLPAELIEVLIASSGVEFWSLQGAGSSSQAETSPVKDALAICGDGLLALAATMANLDLVITADTLPAHLGGTLGVPTWVLLQHAADWRWMNERTDSPWYPSMRLFRQRVPGDWAGVCEQVERALLRVLPAYGEKG